MSNLSTLQNAGLIAQGASFNATDMAIINNLTTDEVNALISVSGKLTPQFIANNIATSGTGMPIGIVF